MSACVPNGTTYTPTFDGEELPHVTGVQWYPEVIVAVRDASSCFGSLSEAEESLFDRTFQVSEQTGLKDLLENWRLTTQLGVNNNRLL